MGPGKKNDFAGQGQKQVTALLVSAGMSLRLHSRGTIVMMSHSTAVGERPQGKAL
jgi:hypothetical protein